MESKNEKIMKKIERKEITKTLISTDLSRFEGDVDNFVSILLKAKEEAKKDGFNIVRVSFNIAIDEDGHDFPWIDVDATKFETVEEAKLRIAAEQARKERESQEHYEAIMEKYKDHD